MKKPKFFIFALVFLFSLNAVFAQTNEKNVIEPSYEVILNVVVASNNAGEKSKLPPSLSGVVGKLKNDYLYTNYNLAATFLERISTNGVIGHAGVLNQLDQTQQKQYLFFRMGIKRIASRKR